MTDLASQIVAEIRERPRHFAELVDLHRDAPWRTFLGAWGEVRAAQILTRDEDGHYLLAERS